MIRDVNNKMTIKEKIKKNLKKAGITLVAAVLASTIMASKAKAETISVYPIYTFSISQPHLDEKFLKILDDKYSETIRDWNLRPPWQPIGHAKALNLVGMGVDISLGENIYLTTSIGACNFNSIYDQIYIFTDPDYGDYCNRLIREEKNEFLKYSCGIKVKTNLSDKLKLGASALVDFYTLNGSVNMTKTGGISGNPASYTQSRAATYTGNNLGWSAGLDLSVMLSEHFSVGAGVQYNSSTVKTNGTEIRTSTSSKNQIKEDYNPELEMDGTYASINISYIF